MLDAVCEWGPLPDLEDVHFAIQRLLEVEDEAAQIDDGPSRIEVHEEVHVTVRARFIARDGPYDTNISGTAAGGQVLDFGAALAELLEGRATGLTCHGCLSIVP